MGKNDRVPSNSPKEDPKQRFAGNAPVNLGSDAGEVDAIAPDAEAAALDDTEREMREHYARLEAERIAREEAAARAAGVIVTDAPQIPSIPLTPPAGSPPPDAYTAALLTGFQMLAGAFREQSEQIRQQNETILGYFKEQQEGKPIPYHQIKPVTPWNPEGKKDRVKLTRPTFLSGYPVNPAFHTEEEITLFNRLKPGRYHNRQWEVVLFQDGSIDVRYPNRSIEQRMTMAAEAPTLSVLLSKIIAEYEERKARRGVVPEVGDEDAERIYQ